MAVMDALNRARALAAYMRDVAGPYGTKPQVAAAIAVADQWCEDNQASFVAALPTGFKNASSAQQKALLLCYVIMRRVGRLRIPEDG